MRIALRWGGAEVVITALRLSYIKNLEIYERQVQDLGEFRSRFNALRPTVLIEWLVERPRARPVHPGREPEPEPGWFAIISAFSARLVDWQITQYGIDGSGGCAKIALIDTPIDVFDSMIGGRIDDSRTRVWNLSLQDNFDNPLHGTHMAKSIFAVFSQAQLHVWEMNDICRSLHPRDDYPRLIAEV